MDLDYNFVWKAIVIVIGGVLILRLAGRKSISQLTVAQTVMMVAVGSLIIQPVSERSIWITMAITFILVLMLIVIEYLALKFDTLESFFYGKAIIVVENGTINQKNITKLRLTVDTLELRIRQLGIHNIGDLQWATIEANGQLGYMLKPEKQYATKEDIQVLISMIQANMPSLPIRTALTDPNVSDNLFTEVKNKEHLKGPPEHLK